MYQFEHKVIMIQQEAPTWRVAAVLRVMLCAFIKMSMKAEGFRFR